MALSFLESKNEECQCPSFLGPFWNFLKEPIAQIIHRGSDMLVCFSVDGKNINKSDSFVLIP